MPTIFTPGGAHVRFIYDRNIKMVGVLPIWMVKSNVSSVGPWSERGFSLTKGLRYTLNVRLYYP